MLCYDPDSACPDASTLYDNSVCYATRLRILGSAGLLKQIACSTIAMSRDVGRGCDALQGEGEQEESSLISVRSRRSRAKRRPRPQQPEQAPASASAQAPAAAAAAAHALAPDTAGSHMPQHAHKRGAHGACSGARKDWRRSSAAGLRCKARSGIYPYWYTPAPFHPRGSGNP